VPLCPKVDRRGDLQLAVDREVSADDGLSAPAARAALTAYAQAFADKASDDLIYTVADYSILSDAARLFVIDLARKSQGAPPESNGSPVLGAELGPGIIAKIAGGSVFLIYFVDAAWIVQSDDLR